MSYERTLGADPVTDANAALDLGMQIVYGAPFASVGGNQNTPEEVAAAINRAGAQAVGGGGGSNHLPLILAGVGILGGGAVFLALWKKYGGKGSARSNPDWGKAPKTRKYPKVKTWRTGKKMQFVQRGKGSFDVYYAPSRSVADAQWMGTVKRLCNRKWGAYHRNGMSGTGSSKEAAAKTLPGW